MILVLLESPGKIKKIESILGTKYKALASIGHIMDLDPKNMSIDVENNFEPQYIINSDKIKVVKDLQNAAKKADRILIATDEDREGEMIAWSIANVLKIKKPERITFNSITKTELLKAIENPRDIDTNLVNAQKARRILDRLVGYKLSPLLYKHMEQKSLSAGRVQSVVARLVVDRENEIKNFMAKDSTSFFKFKGTFSSEGDKPFISVLYDLESAKKDGDNKIFRGPISKIDDEALAREFLTKCQDSNFIVENILTKKRTQGPSAPFTTSTLQQDANRKLGFPGKKTMMAAQRLYEAGFITYMRTDSINLSEEALENIGKYVIKTYGKDYYRKFEWKSKTKNTQEAHEAIRPTDVFTTEVSGGKIGNDEIKLYSLIWKRAVASQMKPAEYDVTSIQISISEDDKHYFMTNIENLSFAGFLAVYNIGNLDEDTEDDDKDGGDDNEKDGKNKNIKIPEIGAELNPKMINGTQEYLRPPGRYNQASLIDKLDPKNLNIGRPATYVTIIEKILERVYIQVADINGFEKESLHLSWNAENNKINEETVTIVLGKEKGKYIPTHLGILVTNFLILNFPKIMDYKFTAMMENKLDDIANGDLVWYEVLKEFYDDFHPQVIKIAGAKSEFNNKYTKLLGVNEDGYEIFATIAKYGPVVKLMTDTKTKPKYAPIKEPLTLETVTLNDALKLFEYPKEIGVYEKKKILLNKGQYGYYLTYNKYKYTLGDKSTVTLDEAIEVIKGKQKKALTTFTNGTKIYSVLDGPYSKYINVYDSKTKKKFNVTLPNNENVDELTLERICEIITEKFNKGPAKKFVKKPNTDEKADNKKKMNNIKKKVNKKIKDKNIQIE